MVAEYSKTLEQIAKPFIENGIYPSTDAFVSNLVKDVSARKIRGYERKIKAFEANYGSFDDFTRKIRVIRLLPSRRINGLSGKQQ